jgi:S1-C subfamily serine protease
MSLSLRARASLVSVFILFTALAARAEKLAITSTPPGAAVEIDGVKLGVTPFTKEYLGGYFHRTKTVFGARLGHPLVARLSLAGYSTKEVVLTEGPMEWIGLKGAKHGDYWLFKSSRFTVTLDSITATFTGSVTASGLSAENNLAPELSLETLAALAKPAVVQLKGLQKMGSGFFVTETGVIATNAHLARDEETLLVLLASGQQIEGKVAYVDPDLDVAFVKVPGEHFPHLSLASADSIRQGESVMAIGNPGDAMLFSMTKGIVSAVGKFSNAGPGTWVQTDAPINPGNSGGPLLNMRGEVVGMNTQKLVKRNVTGIGFALSASDLLEVLERFYPVTVPRPPAGAQQMSAPAYSKPLPMAAIGSPGQATVTFAGAEGARIFVDDRPVGDIPSTVVLSEGKHRIRITKPGFADVFRWIELSAGSSVTIRADF